MGFDLYGDDARGIIKLDPRTKLLVFFSSGIMTLNTYSNIAVLVYSLTICLLLALCGRPWGALKAAGLFGVMLYIRTIVSAVKGASPAVSILLSALSTVFLFCFPMIVSFLLLIQTTRAGHPLWQHLTGGDSEGFWDAQLAERQAAAYPPYTRLVDIVSGNAPAGDGHDPCCHAFSIHSHRAGRVERYQKSHGFSGHQSQSCFDPSASGKGCGIHPGAAAFLFGECHGGTGCGCACARNGRGCEAIKL